MKRSLFSVLIFLRETLVPKVRVYIQLLSMFSAYYQTSLPYHVNGIDSNDTLYAGDKDYLNELQALINKVLEDVLEALTKLKEEKEESLQKAQAKLSFDLFNAVISLAELNGKSATLAVNLYALAKGNVDAGYLNSSVNYLKSKDSPLVKELVKKLASM